MAGFGVCLGALRFGRGVGLAERGEPHDVLKSATRSALPTYSSFLFWGAARRSGRVPRMRSEGLQAQEAHCTQPEVMPRHGWLKPACCLGAKAQTRGTRLSGSSATPPPTPPRASRPRSASPSLPPRRTPPLALFPQIWYYVQLYGGVGALSAMFKTQRRRNK